MNKKKISLWMSLILVVGMFSGCATSTPTIDDTTETESENMVTTTEAASDNTDQADMSDYGTAIFGVDIISLEIIADEETWQSMLDNAEAEEYIKVDVIVNGTRFNDVGIRPKGNSSLREVASSDSDRFSFRLKFDKYVEGQTCFGLDTFVVNNMTGDASYMKEYISYDMMKTIGVDTPYFGFANISVNDNPWGLYLAVELYNDSYEERVFDTTSGMLYNVKMSDMDGEGMRDFGNFTPDANASASMETTDENKQTDSNSTERPEVGTPPEGPTGSDVSGGDGKVGGFPEGGFNPGMAGGFGGMGAGNSGGSLKYTDDNPDSYSAIFDNVVGDEDETANQRVITALKALSEGNDLETYFDVDAILRYFAAHNFVVNLDSYSSSMAQNYYLYEREGQLTLLPWDYNLAWGGFQSGEASSVVNFPIDTPVSGVEMSERPMLEKLLENDAYMETYHTYLQELIDAYFKDGKFEVKVKEIDALITEYVKADATAFYTYDDYQKAVSALITLGNLRSESVQGQLDGTVPSTTATQAENKDALIDASQLNLNDLGSMMGGDRGNRTRPQ